MYRRIVYANDGSRNAFLALRDAVGIAQTFHAHLDVLHFTSVDSAAADAKGVADEERLARRRRLARRMAERRGVAFDQHVMTGHPAEVVIDFAHNHHCDLLVVGASDHHRLTELWHDARSTRIARDAVCSVLVVRAV